MTYKVMIKSGNDSMIFEASAPISESRHANYVGYDITHLPTEIFAYKNTSSRSFSITAKLISRNVNEAKANSRYVDLLRSWVLPDFGNSGATPPLVYLSAFYNTNIDKVPCVMKSYTLGYPEDVDWIYQGAVLNSGKGHNRKIGSSAMPVIMNITVEMNEAYTPAQITQLAWKINQSKGGSFSLGGGVSDVSAAGGGQQQVGSTPSLSSITNDKNFSGIATSKNSLLVNPRISTSIGNGNNSSMFGIINSSSITNSTPQVDTNPAKLNISFLGDVNNGLVFPNNAVSSFGRSTLVNKPFTFLGGT